MQASNSESSRLPLSRIQSVARGCRILLFLASQPHGGKAKDIADAQSLPLPTIHHLLTTLVSEGFLSKDSTRTYHLGPKIGVLSEAFLNQATVPEYFMTGVRRLADVTGETAYLSGWHRGEIRVFAMMEGSHAVRVAGLGGGYQANAHARASGKLLLALASPEVCAAYLDSHPLEALTRRTITNRKELEKELARIRKRGYAIDEEEFAEGVACVSAAICETGVPLAAITLSAPLERFMKRRRELTDAVVEASRFLSSDFAGAMKAV